MKCPTMLSCFLVMLATAKSVSEVLPQAETQLRGMNSHSYRNSTQSQHSDTGIKRHIENIAQPAGRVAAPTTSGNSGGFIKSQGKMSPDQLRTAWASRVQRNRPRHQTRKLAPTSSDSLNHSGLRPGQPPSPARHLNISLSISILAKFAGRNRVLVISAPHKSDSNYQLLMSLMKTDVYCEMAERHMQQIVMFHRAGEMGGTVRHITKQGSILEEPLEAALVPQLMAFLKLEESTFEMVLLKKTLQVQERYPFPVKLEAVFEAVDQAPIRRLERVRQKGLVKNCKEAGVEGQVVKSARLVPKGPKLQVDSHTDFKGDRIKSTAVSTRRQATSAQITSTSTSTTITTSSAPGAITSTTSAALNENPTNAHGFSSTSATADPFDQHSTRNIQSDSYQPSTSTYTTTSDAHETDNVTEHAVSRVTSAKHSTQKNEMSVAHEKKQGEDVSREDIEKATVTDFQDEIISQKGKVKHGKTEKKPKSEKTDKSQKKSKENKKPKALKDSKHTKNPERKALIDEVDSTLKLSDKSSAKKRSLARFISYFEKRRRLIVSMLLSLQMLIQFINAY